MAQLRGIIVGNPSAVDTIYGPAQREQMASLLDMSAGVLSRAELEEDPSVLADIDVMFTAWGAARLSQAVLDHAPRLKAVFHGAGSVKSITTDAFWDRGLLITTAASANAVPVAEYCLSQIIFHLKGGFPVLRAYRNTRMKPPGLMQDTIGRYDARVGLISYGLIARLTRDLLRSLRIDVMVYCPFMTDELAAEHDIIPASMEDIFAACPVVSLHTPNLPETRGMIRAEHFERMIPNAMFLNTARGAVVDEPGMISVLQNRPDLTAVLDVTMPEPPLKDSPLWTMDNVVLTPHIAGSHGPECRRMGQLAVDECSRFLRGEPVKHPVTREQAGKIA